MEGVEKAEVCCSNGIHCLLRMGEATEAPTEERRGRMTRRESTSRGDREGEDGEEGSAVELVLLGEGGTQ